MSDATQANSPRVFITGAASGLGKALALRWAKTGARVCLADVNDAMGQETLAEVNATGAQGVYCHCDVTELTQLQDARDELLARWGGVDVVINNAGVATAGTLQNEDIEQWQWVLNINLLGTVRTSQVFVEVFKRQGRGHLVNVASQAGLTPIPNMASYNAAKAAVVSFSETMALELAQHHVAVTLVCPSFFRTNLDKSVRSKQPGMDKLVRKMMERTHITAEDVAERTYQAVKKRHFMVLTHREGLKVYLLKRFLPIRTYLNMMLKKTVRFRAPAQ